MRRSGPLAAWWYPGEGDLLGLDLDHVLEGPDVVPIIDPPDRASQVVVLPPLSAEERAVIASEERRRAAARARALVEIETRNAYLAATRQRRRSEKPLREARLASPAAREAAQAAQLARVARERAEKQARVRAVIARHVAGRGSFVEPECSRGDR